MNILGGQLTSNSSYEHLGGSAHKIIAPMGFFLWWGGGLEGGYSSQDNGSYEHLGVTSHGLRDIIV